MGIRMEVFVIAFLMIGLPSRYFCYVLDKTENGDSVTPEPPAREKDPEDMNRVLADLSKYLLGEDEKMVEDIAQELDDELSDSSKEFLEVMRKQFMSSLLRMSEGGELYRDARREAVLKSLYTAFVGSNMEEDKGFIDDITRKIKLKEQERRHKNKEYETNHLRAPTNTDSKTQIED